MSSPPIIAFVSDLHLSRRRPFFQFNWEVAIESIKNSGAELVVAGGDLTLDGATSPSDLDYAREQLDRIGLPWAAVPGNHDIGEFVGSSGAVTEERRALWTRSVGPEFWVRDIGDWRIVGLNSMIFKSGFLAEAEQEQMLRAAIETAGNRSVALLAHHAVCKEDLFEHDETGWMMPLSSRQMLSPYLTTGKIQLVLSGDMHQSRDVVVAGVRHIWAPSAAFVTDLAETWRPVFGGRKRVGWTRIELSQSPKVEVVEPAEMVNFDIGNWLIDGPGLYYSFAREREFQGFSHPEGVGFR